MGLKFNTKGFVIRQPDGVVVQDSRVSAATGKPVRQARVLKAVPDTDGLYLSLHRNDELKGAQAKKLYQQARAWFEDQQPVVEADPDENEQSDSDGDSDDGKQPSDPNDNDDK